MSAAPVARARELTEPILKREQDRGPLPDQPVVTCCHCRGTGWARGKVLTAKERCEVCGGWGYLRRRA